MLPLSESSFTYKIKLLSVVQRELDVRCSLSFSVCMMCVLVCLYRSKSEWMEGSESQVERKKSPLPST